MPPRGVLMTRRAQAPPEELESDNESETEAVAPDSTDTEMYQVTEQSLLITHDSQAFKVQNVARIQCKAEAEAWSSIQVQFYEVVDQDIRHVHLKRESEERDSEPKCRPSPQYRPCQEERGRSILKKKMANTDMTMPRQPHGDGEPRGMGSPLVAHPGNRIPMGTTLKPPHLGIQKPGASPYQEEQQTAFQMAMKQCYTDYASSRSRSRKREHTQLRMVTPTPTQSPAQKAFKLKSTVTVVEPASQSRHRSSSHHRPRVNDTTAWRPHRGVPYHLIGVCEVEGKRDQENEKHLLLYIMDRFTWEHYSPELNDFGNAFGSKTVFVTRFCMAAALYFEIAWARGEKWIFPLIPDLLTEALMRREGKLPERPTCSTKRKGDNVKLRCREWWMYLLVLLQCWKDESCAFDYGGALRPDSKVMLFVYHRIKNLLKKVGVVDFHLYQIKSKTNWSIVMLTKYTPDQLTTQREMHREAKEEMTAFKDWMYKRYEVEAICEYNELQASGGNFDTLANRRVDEIRRPGNKDQFRKERAAEQQKAKGTPGAPGGGLDAECQRLSPE